MRLRNAARADGDCGHTADLREKGRIAEPRRAGERGTGGDELLHKWICRRRVQTWRGGSKWRDLRSGIVLLHKFAQQPQRPALRGDGGIEADVHGKAAVIGRDVRTRAALDHAETDGSAAQPFVIARIGKLHAKVAVERLDEPGHFDNRVLAEFRARSMHGDTKGLDVRPETAFVFEDRFHVRRLRDEGKGVVRAVMFRKVTRAVLRGFLRHEAREVNLHRQRWNFVAQFPQGPEHRGHRAFGVARAPSKYFSIAQLRAEGVNRHPADAHRVQMRTKYDARLRLAIWRGLRGKASDDIWPIRQHFFENNFRAAALQKLTDERCTRRLSRVLSAGLAFGIYRGDADEGLSKFNN